jgi:hypothetical protein
MFGVVYLINESTQLIIFATHNIVLPADEAGWLILQVIRAYQVVDMYLSFTVHTSETLAAGCSALKEFAHLIAVSKVNYYGFI